MNRTVRLPEKYWRIIDSEAKRCKRSGERQLEALLSRLFGLGDVNIEINEEGVLANRRPSKKSSQAIGSGIKRTGSKKTNARVDNRVKG